MDNNDIDLIIEYNKMKEENEGLKKILYNDLSSSDSDKKGSDGPAGSVLSDKEALLRAYKDHLEDINKEIDLIIEFNRLKDENESLKKIIYNGLSSSGIDNNGSGGTANAVNSGKELLIRSYKDHLEDINNEIDLIIEYNRQKDEIEKLKNIIYNDLPSSDTGDTENSDFVRKELLLRSYEDHLEDINKDLDLILENNELKDEIEKLRNIIYNDLPSSGTGNTENSDFVRKELLLRSFEDHLKDLNNDIDLLIEHNRLKDETDQLRSIINNELSSSDPYQKKYNILANSKLGKAQLRYWKIIAGIKKR